MSIEPASPKRPPPIKTDFEDTTDHKTYVFTKPIVLHTPCINRKSVVSTLFFSVFSAAFALTENDTTKKWIFAALAASAFFGMFISTNGCEAVISPKANKY